MKKHNVRTLVLVVITFTYLLVGASIFDSLESNEEIKNKEEVLRTKQELLEKYQITTEDYKWIEQMMIENAPLKNGMQWSLFGSFYYCTMVLVTIGYGHSIPRNKTAKSFTMGYAAIGIPLGIIMFSSIGDRLNKKVSGFTKILRDLFNSEENDNDVLGFLFFLSGIIMFAGAAWFSYYEGWSYFDSLYYLFITMSTIGFGDFVAIQGNIELQNKPIYMFISLFCIFFALTVWASFLNILVVKCMELQTEEMQQEEVGTWSQNVVTLDEDIKDDIIYNYNKENVKITSVIEDDQVSVCSCTCYPRDQQTTHPFGPNMDNETLNNYLSKSQSY